LNIEHRINQTHKLKTGRPECGALLMTAKLGKMVFNSIRMTQKLMLKPFSPPPDRTARQGIVSADLRQGVAAKSKQQNGLLQSPQEPAPRSDTDRQN
jgi:hypothetical protein